MSGQTYLSGQEVPNFDQMIKVLVHERNLVYSLFFQFNLSSIPCMAGFIKDSKVIKGGPGDVWGWGRAWRGSQKAPAAGTDAGWESWLET